MINGVIMENQSFISALVAKLKEPSTWRGVSLLLGAIGIAVTPENMQVIGTAVSAIIGAIEVFRKEV